MSTYSTTVLADTPIAYYRLDESSGTSVTDYSGNGYTGTLSGSGTIQGVAGAIVGDSDTAYTFNNSGEVTATVTSLPTGSATWSIEAWINYPSSNSFLSVAVCIGTFTSLACGFIGLDNTGHAQVGTSGGNHSASSVLSTNTWHHFVGTYNGSTMLLYVDGVQVVSTSQSLSLTGATISIASVTGSLHDTFKGSIDEVAIYNAVLTPTRVVAHYQAGLGVVGAYSQLILQATPMAYYRLEEASGTIANDSSGNGYSGTLSGVSAYNQVGAITTSGDAAIQFLSGGTLRVPYTLNYTTFSAFSLEYWALLPTSSIWQYVVVTSIGTTTIFYVDCLAATLSTTAPLEVSALFDFTGSYSLVTLDEVAIYNYVLTPTQILSHYTTAGYISPAITFPSVNRRSGALPSVARRDGNIPATKRR